MENSSEFISIYTRAEAIEDGVIIDVTATAKQAGFKFPVAITRTVFDRYVNPEPMPYMNNMQGRLWDVLNVLKYAIKGIGKSDTVHFAVAFRMQAGKRVIALKSMVSGGDNAEPVITIMLPEED
jgi:hypothetical protein